MSESSPQIGAKLEEYCCKNFPNYFGWKLLGSNLEIKCNRKTSHKNDRNSPKQTHGIDLLFGYFNPMAQRKEAIIIECKHRQWSSFTTNNLNQWILELNNTIDCASNNEDLHSHLDDYILIGGLIVYKSTDNLYEHNKAIAQIGNTQSLLRKSSLLVTIATDYQLGKWKAFYESITHHHNIGAKSSKFDGVKYLYPSINNSKLETSNSLTLQYIFSDFIISVYTHHKEDNDNNLLIGETKNIYSSDTISLEMIDYVKSMISKLQLQYTSCKGKLDINLIPLLYCGEKGKDSSSAPFSDYHYNDNVLTSIDPISFDSLKILI